MTDVRPRPPPPNAALSAGPALPLLGPGALPEGAIRSLRATRGNLAAEPLRRGAAALAHWAGARATELEVVAQRRDADGPAIDRALEMVAAFIRERGLVLFGGLAIDYALRLRGASIYPDDERPDFDVLSPRSVDDAYDLADRLHAAGFEEVGVIRAIHVQTMRVRTNFVYVADIGYAPPEVFAALPTVEFRGMRVIHPDYQRMDQLLAFCYPFNNPPHEDVFHRWRKDLGRFNLYEKFYPLLPSLNLALQPKALTAATASVPVVGDAASLAVAFHGFAAYAILRGTYSKFVASLGHAEVGVPRSAFAITSASSFETEGPAVLVSPCPDRVVAGGPPPTWFDPYMDLIPERVSVGSLSVFSTHARLFGVTCLAAADFVVGESVGPEARLLVVNPQGLMLYFLSEAHLSASREDKALYLSYYAGVLTIIKETERAVEAALKSSEDDHTRRELMDLYMRSPFVPSTATLGTVNRSAAYYIKMAKAASDLQDVPPPGTGLPPDLGAMIGNLPRNYFPPKPRPPPYDYSTSPLFRRSGQSR